MNFPLVIPELHGCSQRQDKDGIYNLLLFVGVCGGKVLQGEPSDTDEELMERALSPRGSHCPPNPQIPLSQWPGPHSLQDFCPFPLPSPAPWPGVGQELLPLTPTLLCCSLLFGLSPQLPKIQLQSTISAVFSPSHYKTVALKMPINAIFTALTFKI